MANTKDFIVKNGLTVGNNITVSGTVDGRDIATDGSKLDGIESGATADQTASEILTLIKTVDGSGSGLDADTLDGLNSTSLASNNYVQTQLGTKLNSSSYTASDVLTKIKTVDGSGSGLDADTLDGLQSGSFSTNNYITDHYTSNNYIQTFVAAEVASVVDSAPAALDTLNELAAALGDDANFSTTVSNQIGIRSTNTYVNSTFSSNNYLQGQLSTKLNSSSYTASDVLTKIKTVDGSGSGLDADLLDGQHGSYYLNTSTSFGGQVSGAYNNITINHNAFDIGDTTPETGRNVHETGIYTFNRNNGTLGTGTDSAYYSVMAFGQGAGGSIQIAGKWTSPWNKLYWRALRDTIDDWTDWREIWHSSNDGSGSGLDADLLDGVQGSSYLRSDTSDTFTGDLTINGALSATTKSFDIKHPSKDGMRLRYGSLEGPENGVYVRGKSKEKIIELPDYWLDLVHEDSITVHLTAIGKPQELFVEKIEDNKVYVSGENYFFTVTGERKDVERFEVEYNG